MLVVLLTAFLSVKFEHVVSKFQSPQKVQQTINQLIDFRDELILALETEDFDVVSQLLLENRQYYQQFLIFDEFSNEVLGREQLILSPIQQRFNQQLTNKFIEQRIDLTTMVVSDFGQIFYLKIQPMMPYHPLFSPRVAGSLIRIGLLVLFSAVACYLLAKTLTLRIKRLQQATRKTASGDYQTEFSNSDWGRDELGQLGNDFQKMAQQLMRSQQQRQQMLSDISHELRSPLARMQVALAIVQDRFPDTKQQIVRAEKEVMRMRELITQIIQLQKLSLYDKEEAKQSVNLIALLEKIIDDANYEYQATNKQITLTTNQKQCILNGNNKQLYSAFENIIRNALSHTKEQTTAEVSIEKKNHYFHIRVKDYGSGIVDKNLTNKRQDIFQPFVRLDSSRNRQTGGYGLGLSIAKAVIEKHHGTIDAYNHQSPSGLIIRVTLPILSIAK